MKATINSICGCSSSDIIMGGRRVCAWLLWGALLLCTLPRFVTSISRSEQQERGMDLTLNSHGWLSDDGLNRERSLQFLQEIRWNISDPDFSYDELTFNLEWRVSDYIQDRYATFTVYDGWDCKDGSNDITADVADYINNDFLFQNLGLQPNPATPPNSGLGYRDIGVYLHLEPLAATTNDIFYYVDENGLRGRLDFCIRFSLYNEDPSLSDSVEVNFQETLIAFYADLQDGFEVQDVVVTMKDQIEKDAFIACEIIAYECDRQNRRLPNPGYLRDQGNEVRVCVELSEESKNEGLFLDRIIWFYFMRDYLNGDVVRQNAIIPDSLPALSGLTDYDCLRGIEICGFDTILRADFYRTGVGIVQGIGEGLCQFGGTSYLVEDVPKIIGEYFGWIYHDHQISYARKLNITGFPVGTKVWYNDTDFTPRSVVVDSEEFALIIDATDYNDARLRKSLDSLEVLAPLHSDVDFVLSVDVETTARSNHVYIEKVRVYAVADPPQVSATDVLQVEEGGNAVLLQVDPDRSEDEDNSESLSVRILVPQGEDGLGPVGTIEETSSLPGISVTGAGTGSFLVAATGPDPATREEILDNYLDSSIAFKPRPYWSGILLNRTGLLVRAISTEAGPSANPNSEFDGTLGDMDTKTEDARTWVDIICIPYNDLPYLTRDETVVQENKNISDVDVDLDLYIGREMGIVCDDMDGSQSMSATLTGFPLNLIDMYFGIDLDGVTTSVSKATGTVTIAGDNNVDVLAVLDSLRITLAHDDDKNFNIVIDGTSTDRPIPNPNGEYFVSGPYHLEHYVRVEAVADTPTVNAGSEIKTLSAEESGFKPYPVEVGLNDFDGSETFLGREVSITFWTPTNIAKGNDPSFDFGSAAANVNVTKSGDTVTLSGDGPALELAMQSMMIQPGSHNGEDINITVKVTSFESNPTEEGEVAVPTVTSLDLFTIPIDPVIQGEPVFTVPPAAAGPEDTRIDLPTVEVTLNGIEDVDGSEKYYVEVLRSSFRRRTKFFIDGVQHPGTEVGDWLRLPNPSSNFEIKPPPNFSGMMNMELRGRITDYTNSGNATKITDSYVIPISVYPVADDIDQPPSKTVGVEDLGAVNFGSTLNGGQALDDGSGWGNNPESETIMQIQFVVPQDTTALTYSISGIYAPAASGISDGSGTAKVTFDAPSRTYTLTSTTITGDIASIPITDREAAEEDIRNTLTTFMIELGPEHTDLNGIIYVSFTTLDVNLGDYSTKDIPFDHDIVIQAVADAGGVFAHETAQVLEDGDNIPLKIDVTRSDDDDDSETLSVSIMVPSDSVGPIGTIVGSPPQDVNLASEGNGNYLVTTTDNSATPAERETLLNAFLSLGDIEFDPRENFSGNATLQVNVISTEGATGDEVAPAQYGGDDNDSKTETVTDYIQISVRPVADNPDITIDGKVKANAVGDEDTGIEIPLVVTLSDTDGSETYIIEIKEDSVPSGATIFGENGDIITKSGGVYTLQHEDVLDLVILPPQDYSSEYQGDIVLNTTTVVTDSSFGFTSVLRIPMNITVQVNEVSDQPNYRSIHVVGNEDEDYKIGEFIGNLAGVLVDTDGSETLSLVLTGLKEPAVAKTAGQTGISYNGDGEWQVEADAIPSLVITPKFNYAGDNPYRDLKIRAVSQEVEGDETSREWDVSFHIYPIADGFANWKPKISLSEQAIEDGTGVSLSNAGEHTMADPDSEYVIEYYFDLSNLLDDASIGLRLDALTGITGAGVDDLVASNYIEGTFDYDSSSKTITVARGNIDGIALGSDLFLDSNVDFEIPVSALVEDMAMINSTQATDQVTEYGTFIVDLVGTADIPTIIADDIRGDCRLPVKLGGDVTDTDALLGRPSSETVSYIVKTLYAGNLPGYTFTDANNKIVGFDGGEETWMFTKAEVDAAIATGGLFLMTQFEKLDANVTFTRRTLQGAADSPPEYPAVATTNTRDLVAGTAAPTDPPTPPPTPDPTNQPTPPPTPDPTNQPTPDPTNQPTTPSPTGQPTIPPTPSPTVPPTPEPTTPPTTSPTPAPTTSPSQAPSASGAPSSAPSSSPTVTAAEFAFMVIAQENDGDLVTVSTTFSVVYWDQSSGADNNCPGGPGVPIPPPKPPKVTVGPHDGTEDTNMALDIVATPADDDFSHPTVSIIISKWPDGMTFNGDFRKNHMTGSWAAPAEEVNGGAITLTPPGDFSGYLDITVEVIAVNAYFLEASTGEFNVTLYFDPVADAPKIELPSAIGYEDQTTDLAFVVTKTDTDGSEEIATDVYIKVDSNDCWLNENYPVVSQNDADSSVDDIPVAGYFRIPLADIGSLSMNQTNFWHGICPVSVVAQSIETLDDNDGDKTASTKVTFNVNIFAVANPPEITFPPSISGPEDTFIPIPGLSTTRIDNVISNGEEVLSATFSNVPVGTLFQPGVNGGNEVWNIPVEELANLKVKAPTHYSGNFTMTFNAISKELDGGDERTVSGSIEVMVTPVADNFFTLGKPVHLELGGAPQPLDLSIRMDDTRGTLPGENPEERINITFTSVPSGLALSTTQGGDIIFDAGSGGWTFSGTQDQSNALEISGNTEVGVYSVDMSAVTIDGSSVFSPPKVDYFMVNVSEAAETSTARFLQGDVIDDVLGIRHCNDQTPITWDSSRGAYPLPIVSINQQDHWTVEFSVSHDMPGSVNWAGVLFPLSPSGDNACDKSIDTSPTSFTANCFDYQARVYFYLNVNGAPEDQVNAYVPLKCQNIAEDGDVSASGTTIVYELLIPCSACSANRARLLDSTSELLSSVGVSVIESYSDRLLQEDGSDGEEGGLPGPASRIDLELVVDGNGTYGEDDEASSKNGPSGGAIFGIIVAALFSCCCCCFVAFVAFKRWKNGEEEEEEEEEEYIEKDLKASLKKESRKKLKSKKKSKEEYREEEEEEDSK